MSEESKEQEVIELKVEAPKGIEQLIDRGAPVSLPDGTQHLLVNGQVIKPKIFIGKEKVDIISGETQTGPLFGTLEVEYREGTIPAQDRYIVSYKSKTLPYPNYDVGLVKEVVFAINEQGKFVPLSEQIRNYKLDCSEFGKSPKERDLSNAKTYFLTVEQLEENFPEIISNSYLIKRLVKRAEKPVFDRRYEEQRKARKAREKELEAQEAKQEFTYDVTGSSYSS